MQQDGYIYTVKESGNLQLGQKGSLFEGGTTAITGKRIVAIQVIDDCTFSVLTPHTDFSAGSFIGTTNQSGDSVSGVSFPGGITIFGVWDGFTLSGGKVVAYLG
jgi:hypothetical protein